MNVIYEFVVDCISRDDYVSLQKMKIRHEDFSSLNMYIPAILRACRDIESMCGHDNIEYKYTQEKRLTMLELAHFATPLYVLTKSSNLGLVNDAELVTQLLDMIDVKQYQVDELMAAARRGVENKMLDVPMIVLNYIFDNKFLNRDSETQNFVASVIGNPDRPGEAGVELG